MTTISRQHFVTFFSPGTFVAETTTKPIERPEPKLAVALSEQIVERHGAKPYAFRFSVHLVGEMADGEGGTLRSQKPVSQSGLYFLGGKLETYDEIANRNDEKEGILRCNMRANGYWVVCVNTNSFRSTMPFEENDVVLDAAGDVIARGDAPELLAYRASMTRWRQRDMGLAI